MEESAKDVVLVVDDNITNLMMAQKILGAQYSIAAAKSGAKALQYLENHIPGLILMDINMPDMDGFEAFGKIKEIESCRDIPVIFLTADRNPDTEKKCFDVGAVDYVTKPFVPDVLLSRVARSLELEKYKKNLEEIIAEQTRDLEHALQVKSDFLANMSHEIRTPMNAVLGMAEMALREEMTPAARDYIHQIKASGKNLLVIINDILDFSKIESGKMDIVPVTYEPFSMINDISNIVCNHIDDKDLEFIMDISPEIPGKLIGDNVRIQQIMINLLNNAVKFTKSGQVKLKLRCQRKDDENILLKGEVSDTGIGIKQEDIPRLFGSFQQLDSKRNRNIEGTGLGLKISRQLLELMDGSISVESVYEHGTTFSFELPQKITDNTTLLPDNVKTDITVGILISNVYIKTQIISDLEYIGVKYEETTMQEILCSDDLFYDFLIAENICYNENINNLFANKNSKAKCIVIDDHNSRTEIINPNTIILHKPVYFTNLYAALGIIDEYERTDSNTEEVMNFIAPEALILIVDDNSVNLTVAKGLLNPLRMNVDTADGAHPAIELAKQKKYDIIFMDHMMPEMDGVETTHVIRQQVPGYETVPIIALTANALAETREMFLREGMNDFVAKPVGTKDITEKIHHWLPPEKIQYVETEDAEDDDDNSELVIGNLNVKNAISLLGSKNLYLTVLKDYFLTIDSKSAAIRRYFDNQMWHDYTIDVHSLKSTSRQIGADALAELAYELELAGKNNNIELIREKTNAMLEMYVALKQVLAPVFPDCTDDVEIRPASAKVTLKHLDELSEALENFDTLTIDEVVKKMSEYEYSGKHAEEFEQITDAAENCDIDRLNEIIGIWRDDIDAGSF